jgi:phage terminase Nu1 subunit (DNA packaging protein)
MTKQELAGHFRVSEKTVQRWIAQGCPHTRDDQGRLDFDRYAVARWLGERASHESSGADAPTPPESSSVASKENLNRAELMRRLATARKTELEVQAEKNLKDSGLGAQIRAARTFEDLGQLTNEVTALLGEGALRPNRASALHKLLVERRLQLTKLQEREAGNPLAGRVRLCTGEVEDVVAAFEALYSEERRARAVRFLAQLLDEDLAEHPPTDTSPTERAP